MTTDITNLTDRALDIVLTLKTDPDAADTIDAMALTVNERLSIVLAMGWESRRGISDWIAGAPSRATADPKARPGFDFEAAILDEQEIGECE
jgi:hypothetical protein